MLQRPIVYPSLLITCPKYLNSSAYFNSKLIKARHENTDVAIFQKYF